MKKLFIFFVFTFICLHGWSQFRFGFKGGVGGETITGCPLKTKPRIAFMGGMWVRVKISKSWAMEAELYEIAKGTGGVHQDPPRYGDYRLQLLYLEAPVLFRYYRKQAYIEFGPGFAVLINSGEYTNGGAFPYPDGPYPIGRKDFSFNIGTGYQLNEKWCVELRLNHSLIPIRKQLPEISRQVYNRGIFLSFNRQINLKGSGSKKSLIVE